MPRLNIQSNDFDVTIRHNEFAKAVKSEFGAKELALYSPVVRSKVNLFYTTNWSLCKRAGVEPEDLKQVILCWVVNYHGLYSKGDPKEDILLAHHYVRQRLFRLKDIMDRKAKNCDFVAIMQADAYKPYSVEPEVQPAQELVERLDQLPKRKALTVLRQMAKSKDKKIVAAAEAQIMRISPKSGLSRKNRAKKTIKPTKGKSRL